MIPEMYMYMIDDLYQSIREIMHKIECDEELSDIDKELLIMHIEDGAI